MPDNPRQLSLIVGELTALNFPSLGDRSIHDLRLLPTKFAVGFTILS